MQHHAARVERFGVVHLSPLLQNELKDVADIFVRTEHVRFHNRLANLGDCARLG